MKKFWILLLTAISTLSVAAQSVATKPATSVQQQANEVQARAATDALVEKYKLNADQAKQMYQIQKRKLRNLAEIQALKSQNPALWRSKMASVQEGTLSSIRRILRSKEQVTLFQQTQSDVRRLKSAKTNELGKQKATQEAIDNALLDIYAE
ncbi:MAG: hypothetical protein J0L99_11845 [Chitinophagales bacterium]|nr:hypothetical protein [Chitinophagales bacterium]